MVESDSEMEIDDMSDNSGSRDDSELEQDSDGTRLLDNLIRESI